MRSLQSGRTSCAILHNFLTALPLGDGVRAPSHYASRAELWQKWLDDNPDAKPSTRRMVEHVVAAYHATLPAAVLEFERLRTIAPSDDVATRGAQNRAGAARRHGVGVRRKTTGRTQHRRRSR